TVFLGPVGARNVRVRLDPLDHTYSGEGELYGAAAANLATQLGAAVRLDAITALPTDPPFPVSLGVEGGLLVQLNASLLGSLGEKVLLKYDDGDFSLDLTTELKLGAMLSADLSGYINAQLYDIILCEYIWPFEGADWQGSIAGQMTFPLKLTYD